MDKIIQFPAPGMGALMWASVALLFVLAGAVALELLRQSAQRKRHQAVLWRHAKEVADDKELSQAEFELLREVITRWAPADPLRAISSRQVFDHCVEAEMARLLPDRRRFEEVGLLLRDIRIRLALDYIPLGQRILSTREIYQGQQIWLTQVDAPHQPSFRGAIAAVDEARFCVAPRGVKESPVPRLKPGDRIRCRMWRDEDARYVFDVKFQGQETEPHALIFDHTSNLRRTQARAHYRVRFDYTTTFGVVNAPPDGGIADLEHRPVITRLRGRVTNISAGGYAVVLPQPLPKRAFLKATFDLYDSDPFEVFGRIVGSSALSGGRHLIRTAFVAISEEDRDKIAKHVMYRQQAAKQDEDQPSG